MPTKDSMGHTLPVPQKYIGSISLVSQSGAYGGVLANEMNQRGIGLGKLASIGNQMDVRHQEMVTYWR